MKGASKAKVILSAIIGKDKVAQILQRTHKMGEIDPADTMLVFDGPSRI